MRSVLVFYRLYVINILLKLIYGRPINNSNIVNHLQLKKLFSEIFKHVILNKW